MNLAVTASRTVAAAVYGLGVFVACAVIDQVVNVNRFDSPAAFAAYAGTAPVKVSSGKTKIYRLSWRARPPGRLFRDR